MAAERGLQEIWVGFTNGGVGATAECCVFMFRYYVLTMKP